MKQILKNKRGESILETVIAMTILAIGITFSSAIIGSSLSNVNLSKNRIVAVNIAREGIETMRNIRDTNWLKFATKRRQCWNNDPFIDNCQGATPITPGQYTIYKNDEQKWMLEDQLDVESDDTGNAFPDAPDDGDVFRRTDEERTYIWNEDEIRWIDKATLYLVDIDPLTDTDLDHDYTNDTDSYNHMLVRAIPLGTEVKRTIYKRYIKIEYVENVDIDSDGILVSTPTQWENYAHNVDNLNRMRITATVVWRGSKKEHKSELSTHITDYLGRERLEG